MRLVVKSPAWEDLFSIARFIHADNPGAASAFINEAQKAFTFLVTNPYMGRLRTFSIAGIRSWRIVGFENYLIFYLPEAEEVKILAVLHGARDLSAALEDRL